MGTGDGRFVIDQARQYPDKLCIGIDAAADALRTSSLKTITKPERGGVSNALFVWASVESLPSELNGLATQITINYPWGSLLQALVQTNLEVLKGITNLARPGACLTILINFSVFENEEYCRKLDLPCLTLDQVKSHLVRQYREVGIDLKTVKLLEKDIPYVTTWGQKLTQGSGSRRTLFLKGMIQ